MFSLLPCLQDPNGGHCLQSEYVNPSHTSISSVIYDLTPQRGAWVSGMRRENAEWVSASDKVLTPAFFFIVNTKLWLASLSQTCRSVLVNNLFFFFLAGSTMSRFCFNHTRSQLYYQRETSAWHRMSWWCNEIKEVSHTCSHCVLVCGKCLLCRFCNLGERCAFSTIFTKFYIWALFLRDTSSVQGAKNSWFGNFFVERVAFGIINNSVP